MDSEQLAAKVKKITNKNKKLLQSVSTHLINNPDELEGKLHEHRFLEQKYNQLIGFSRDNVDKFQKLQSVLIEKDEQIYRLNRMLADSKDQAVHRVQVMQRQNRRKREKDEKQMQQQKEEIKKLKKQLEQREQKCRQLENEAQKYKKLCDTTEKQIQQCTEQMKIIQNSHHQKIKMLEDKIEQYKKELTQSEEDNKRLKNEVQKKKKMELMDDLRGTVDNFRKRENY